MRLQCPLQESPGGPRHSECCGNKGYDTRCGECNGWHIKLWYDQSKETCCAGEGRWIT
ncbi:hypothetical protein DPMN_160143 [Dreissena polymorpha]|uniref:Uncharacterized protein n=1 Tax=Dreissena polymorpha TaxID=45954 RepID=A0A9D4EPL2_DREPO|nr:hypothetical protein DPMN_160143 [Dreissena polymorpha]